MPFQSPFNAIANTIGAERSLFSITDTETVDAPTALKAVGQFSMNAANFGSASTFIFRSAFHVSSGALTGTVTLYNLTDGEVVASFATSSTTPQAQEANLTVGVGVGDLKTSARIYEVRISVTGALVTDVLTVGSGMLVIN
jgi:hypothetical protein